jgi:hypothetical protein
MSDWPALPYAEWKDTIDTLQRWTQIVGKTQLDRTPHLNHWWNVALMVTSAGLRTSPMRASAAPEATERTFDAEFDLREHRLVLRTSDGQTAFIPLEARSVAEFYAIYQNVLAELGITIAMNSVPCEVADTTPFELDTHHASYDEEYVERFHTVVLKSHDVLRESRSVFLGKSSPVHFFWGSFDLAVTRFSGRRNLSTTYPDRINREAYSHEVMSCGFWPGDARYPHAAFYAYAVPPPEGFADRRLEPAAAHWDSALGEFILDYEDVRTSATPERDVLAFCQTAYEAAAELANWDRTSLEISGA